MTPEQKSSVLELHGTGRSARKVAEEIGGITRAAVLGMWWRNGLSSPSKSSLTRRANAIAPETRASLKLARIMQIMRRKGIPFERLSSRSCSFIVAGEGADASFCGRTAMPGVSWCPEHYAICFTRLPTTSKKRQVAAVGNRSIRTGRIYS